MTVGAPRWLVVSVLVVAVIALVGSVLWFFGAGQRAPHGSGWRGGMTVPGDGPVRSLDEADHAAERFADRWGLRVGEVMEFTNGYYAELVDSAGAGATEVLIDPGSGAVRLEWGPAMMWNTEFGMHATGRADEPAIGPEDAGRLADEWLAANQPGLRAGQAERFPGYYTLHTLRDDRIVGMLSVNSATGEVWYHDWHGEFVQAREHAETG